MSKSRMLWTFAITSVALFMVVLDNLVVTTALPTIQRDLSASIEDLEWTVNAYTLSFAVLMLTGAALGDRFGRRRIFLAGLVLFTGASAAAALAPGVGWLVSARALQGVGAALVMPLTLTILADAIPAERRGLAIGGWGAIAGLGVALGPLVGGAVVEGIQWQWIFWLNVPVGVAVMPLAVSRLRESYGPDKGLDLGGLGLASAGLFGVVWGLVRGNSEGWTSLEIAGSLPVGLVLLGMFVWWERRSAEPMLPVALFRNRGFSAANVAALLMSFGMFGSIFLLTQYLQGVQGASPLEAGLKTLPWTAMPMIVAPIAGALTDRIGGGPLITAGLALQAASLGWLSLILSPDVGYSAMVPPFVLAGVGMGLFYAPISTVVLQSVRREQEGKASGANSAVREVGGVFGIAVLASVFSHAGGYGSAQSFTDGIVPALTVGAVVVAVGSGAAALIPRPRRSAVPEGTVAAGA